MLFLKLTCRPNDLVLALDGSLRSWYSFFLGCMELFFLNGCTTTIWIYSASGRYFRPWSMNLRIMKGWLGQSSRDEAYGVPFFILRTRGSSISYQYPMGHRSVYRHLGGVLQSGGIEVLEGMLSKGRSFKKLQDLLDLYSRFERLTEQMILPEMDQDVNFFIKQKVRITR